MTIPVPLSVRIEKYVQRTDGCWLWTGAKNQSGYGVIWDRARGANSFAHRAMYELNVGPIPPEMFLCHHCDVPNCVRPNHLFVGTPKDNSVDSSRKGRRHQQQITHCKRGHEFTVENTRINTNGNGRRKCIACQNLSNAKSNAARGPEFKEYMRVYRAAHRERYNFLQREYTKRKRNVQA